MDGDGLPRPEWIDRGKTITELIAELRTFENQDLEVRISIDGGRSSKPISLVIKDDSGCCLLEYFVD